MKTLRIIAFLIVLIVAALWAQTSNIISHGDQHEKAGFDTVQVDVTSDVLNLPTVDVREHGAKCDGTTDDTVAIQAAIDASAGARTVLIPSATCSLDSFLTLPSNTSIRGVSRNESILKFTFTGGGSGYIRNSDTTNGNDNISITNLRIEGNSDGLPQVVGNSGLLFFGGSDIIITDCHFHRTRLSAINFRNVQKVIISNNLVTEVGAGGFHIVSPMTTGPVASKDIVISDNVFWRIGDDAISVFASETGAVNTVGRPRRIAITGNTIMQWDSAQSNISGSGITVGGVQDVTISGNVISQTTSRGIAVSADIEASGLDSRRIVISNNIILRPGFHNAVGAIVGIDVSSVVVATITGNVIDAVTTSNIGIRVQGNATHNTRDVVVSNNVVTNSTSSSSGDAAILILGTADGDTELVIVSDNIVRGNDGGGIRSQGADLVYILNNIVKDNGTKQSGPTDTAASGIIVQGAAFALSVVVRGNHVFDTRGTKKQTYGLTILGGSLGDLVIKDNELFSNETGSLNIVTTPTVLNRFNNRLVATDIGSQFQPVALGSLGTPTDGAVVYCTNCARGGVPCAAGTGAMAKRENGAWNCD